MLTTYFFLKYWKIVYNPCQSSWPRFEINHFLFKLGWSVS